MAVQQTWARPAFVGLSSDAKPTGVAAGARFIESDTGLAHVYDGTAWSVVKGEA